MNTEKLFYAECSLAGGAVMFTVERRIWCGAGLLAALLLWAAPVSAQWIVYPPYPGPVFVTAPVSSPSSSGIQTAAAPSYGAAPSEEVRPSYYSEDYSGSDSSDAPLDKKTAEIRVRLPARAELWSNGKKTTLTGPVREFVTPELQPERVYTYNLKARWVEDGMTVEKSLGVRTFAGSRVTVNFVRRPAPPPPRTEVARVREPAEPSLPPPQIEQRPIDWSASPRSFNLRPY